LQALEIPLAYLSLQEFQVVGRVDVLPSREECALAPESGCIVEHLHQFDRSDGISIFDAHSYGKFKPELSPDRIYGRIY